MMRKVYYYIISSVILCICMISFFKFAAIASNSQAIEFLSSYGWETDGKCIESETIIIPEPFDLVYENYNNMQLEAGLDLRPFMGKKGVRYTYKIINYPQNIEDEVRANVIIIDGKCVAGDICTLPLNGFMHSLVYPVK